MKKIKSFLPSLLFLILAGAIFFGIIKANNITNVKDLYDWAYKKSQDYKDCAERTDMEVWDCIGPFAKPEKGEGINIDLDRDKFPNLGEEDDVNIDLEPEDINIDLSNINLEEMKMKLEGIEIGNAEKIDYNRADWKHWTPRDRNCWNTREAVLMRDAKDITLLDSKKIPTSDQTKACHVISGTWVDPYSGKTILSPKELDVDHIIPLSYAARHGGNDWDIETKELFANDMENLLAVSSTENRRKSDKGPSKYMPENTRFHCEYSIKFINIADKYALHVTGADKRALDAALTTCPGY